MLDKLKSLVGYEREFCDGQPIEEGMIRRFAEAIGDDNPIYRDKNFAEQTPSGGIVAPPTFVSEWNHHEVLTIDEHGIYLGDTRLPGRLLRAGNEYEFLHPLRQGDIITTKSKVSDVYEKKGMSGTMTFIACESTYFNQRHELSCIQRSLFIVLP